MSSLVLQMNSLVELFFDDSSSDEDEEIEMAIALYADTMSNKKPEWGGSVPRRLVLYRNRQVDHDKLMDEYFGENPVYG